jgi:hypothetical protein
MHRKYLVLMCLALCTYIGAVPGEDPGSLSVEKESHSTVPRDPHPVGQTQNDDATTKGSDTEAADPSKQESMDATDDECRASSGSCARHVLEKQQCPGRPFCGAHQVPSEIPRSALGNSYASEGTNPLSVKVMVLTFNTGATDNLVSVFDVFFPRKSFVQRNTHEAGML